ncbi:MAG: hypothetical protein LBN27_14040 [Prevotellaceae bacterium]|jgi:hypothetical protein|nr:hypothetical protein [Prevotellaceae bacterium]
MNKNKLLNIIIKEIQELETAVKGFSDKIDNLKNLVELLQEEETAEVKEEVTEVKEEVIEVTEVNAEEVPAVAEPVVEIIVEKEPERVVETPVTSTISVTSVTSVATKTILADTIKTTSLNEKLSEKASRSLDKALSNQKITDLKKSISLNDKFRFQREIFGGNAALLNQTLDALNEISDKGEATEFLADLNLDSENATVAAFLELINRKFI